MKLNVVCSIWKTALPALHCTDWGRHVPIPVISVRRFIATGDGGWDHLGQYQMICTRIKQEYNFNKQALATQAPTVSVCAVKIMPLVAFVGLHQGPAALLHMLQC